MKPRLILPHLLAISAILCASAPGANGQGKDPVNVSLTAHKIVGKEGKENLESAKNARPGDVIQYEAVYRNNGSSPVKGLQATVPVPQGLTYLTNSSKPASAQASLDGKNFAPMPLMRAVKKADGTTEKQPVPLEEYRALRWTIDVLEPGKDFTVQLRAAVRTNAPPAK